METGDKIIPQKEENNSQLDSNSQPQNKTSSLRKFSKGFGYNRNRGSRDVRIFTEEEFQNQSDPEGPIAPRDAVVSVLSDNLKNFALQNYPLIKAKITQQQEQNPPEEKPLMMGTIAVSPLLPGSAKGEKRQKNLKGKIVFETAKEIIKAFQKKFPSPRPISTKKQEKRLKTRKVVALFGKTPFDTGSVEVQIALKTLRIEELKEHFQTHKKDLHSKRGFFKLIQERKSLLKYLKRENLESYQKTIETLGLRG